MGACAGKGGLPESRRVVLARDEVVTSDVDPCAIRRPNLHPAGQQDHDRYVRALGLYLKAVHHAPDTFSQLVDQRRRSAFSDVEEPERHQIADPNSRALHLYLDAVRQAPETFVKLVDQRREM
ncbi:unnamed protein product [Effrenium voratum]|uniref:Uncharacterized protein n=1 Tax=Effrenium voratum TaxID=2562239 RepID=A0AA36IVJ8_9DINO|nr:unnamed protein product [Effrenium voratum]CAJ1440993.1 unnamed protein product [Effrenium voratum]